MVTFLEGLQHAAQTFATLGELQHMPIAQAFATLGESKHQVTQLYGKYRLEEMQLQDSMWRGILPLLEEIQL